MINKPVSMKTTGKTKKAAVGEFSEADLLKSVTSFVDTLKSGKAHTLRTTTYKLPDRLPARSGADVRAVREKLGASQAVLASLLNTPARTVRSWENNQRKPSGAALKLLSIAEEHPEIFTRQSTIAAPKKAPVPEEQNVSLIDGFDIFFSGKPLPHGIKIVNAKGEPLADVRKGPNGRPMIFGVNTLADARRVVTRHRKKATRKAP